MLVRASRVGISRGWLVVVASSLLSSIVTSAIVITALHPPAPACVAAAPGLQWATSVATAPGLQCVATAPGLQWATSVLGWSSEWSPTSWSAKNVLGAPNVYPAHGDLQLAWAARDPDAPVEFIEVGFAQPMRASALSIVETFNPGAVSEVELVTTSGKRITIQREVGPAGAQARVNEVAFACTDEPIASVRVTLASREVPGWNEIDAIGLVGCTIGR